MIEGQSRCFADSIYMLTTVKSHPDLAPVFQIHPSSCQLHAVSTWMSYALLIWKVKTKFITAPPLLASFIPKSPHLSNTIQLPILVSGHTIPQTIYSVTQARNLGVILNTSLSFIPYIQSTPGGSASWTALNAVYFSQDSQCPSPRFYDFMDYGPSVLTGLPSSWFLFFNQRYTLELKMMII